MEEYPKVAILYRSLILFLFVFSLYSQDFSWNISQSNKNLKEISSSDLFRYAEESNKKGYYEISIQYLTEYLERNPKQLDAIKLLIKNYLQINDLKRAENLIELGKNTFPEDVFFKIYDSILLLKKGNLIDAEKIIEGLENQNTQNTDFYLLKGQYYLLKNNYDYAEFYFKKYLSQNPNDDSIYLFLIDTYLKNNQTEKAKYYIDLYKKIFSNNINLFKIQGDYFYKLYLNEKIKEKKHLYYLEEAYLNYKTYLNYSSYDPNIWKHLLYIAYLLNDDKKIKHLINDYPYNLNDPLLASNVSELLNNNQLKSLQDLCNKNQIFFSCIRYDFYIKQTSPALAFERSKYYLSVAQKNQKKITKEDYKNLLIWAQFLYPKNIEILKTFLEFYKENQYFEDYYLTLQNIILEDKDNPKWKILMERFLSNKNQYVMFQHFNNVPLTNIKQKYQRKKIKLIIFNPYPLEKYEHHFRESDLVRNYLDFYTNQIDLLQSLEANQWLKIKERVLSNPKYYLFYQPEILSIIREWEIENQQNIDYFLESYYRIIENTFYIRFILMDKNGLLINQEEYYITNHRVEKLASFLKEFLLKNITLKANFIDIYNNNVIINLGKEDFIKENQVFKHQNNYYRVKKVYPYTSLVELIQGKATNYTNSDIFIKVSR